MKASRPPARTSRTPRWRRPGTTSRPGIKRLTTETGAGQWGSSLAFAGALFGIDVTVFQVRVLLRPEALSPRADGNLWRALHRLAVERDRMRPRHPEGASRHPRLARHRHFGSGRGRGQGPGRSNMRSARCSTTSCCTRPSSARRRSSSSRWPATIPTSSSAAPAAARTSPASPSRSSACSCAAAASGASSRSSRRPARR